MRPQKLEIHHPPSAAVMMLTLILFATLILLAMLAVGRVFMLQEELEAAREEIAELRVTLELQEEALQRHAAALAAHQEYIEAKQKGFASAWHYKRHAERTEP